MREEKLATDSGVYRVAPATKIRSNRCDDMFSLLKYLWMYHYTSNILQGCVKVIQGCFNDILCGSKEDWIMSLGYFKVASSMIYDFDLNKTRMSQKFCVVYPNRAVWHVLVNLMWLGKHEKMHARPALPISILLYKGWPL